MAETNTTPIGHYYVRRALVYPHMMTKGVNTGQVQFDISPMVYALGVSESIGTAALSVHLKVLDNSGFLENYPLRGEERLTLEVEDAMKNVRLWDLFIYKIDDVEAANNNKGVQYTLHAISFQSFLASNLMITMPLKHLTISDMAQRVFDLAYVRPNGEEQFADNRITGLKKTKVFNNTKKQLTKEPTEGFTRVVIPRMTGQGAMEFLIRRAFSHTSPSTSFRFFENSDGFYFVSDEWLVKRNAENEKHSFTMTFDDGIPKNGTQFELEFNNITSITNTKRADTLEDIAGGAYKNHVINLDMMRSSANLRPDPNIDYDYYKAANSYRNKGAKAELLDLHTKEFIEAYSRYDNAVKYIIYKDWSEGADNAAFQLKGDQYYDEIARNRIPFRKHLASTIVVATGAPRLDITPGDTIILSATTFSADTQKIEPNVKLSGKYLVASIDRILETGTGENRYTLLKVNWDDVVKTGESGALSLRAIRDAVSR